MANPVCEVLLTEAELTPPAPEEMAGAGAVNDFLGVVRPGENGREIDGLFYEAHQEMAVHQLRLIAREAIDRFELRAIILQHRIGFVEAGRASLFLRVAAPHRREAFAASQWVVDELKKRVPIWKAPRFAGGRSRQERPAATVSNQ